VVIQRQLGHANRGTTSQAIDSAEIIHTVHGRPSPVVPATAGLQIRAKPAKRRVGRRDWLVKLIDTMHGSGTETAHG
jgi:hypothetical protein